MIYETFQQLLNEFFLDVQQENLDFSLGDLFDPSQLRLTNVFLRTELINALHLPFELKAAFLGDVKIEGFVGFVAGSPLNISVDNVCLVLGHKPVEWNNDLAFRYAKELLIATLQSFSNPSYEGKRRENSPESESFISPAKWFMSRVQTALAETTIKLERIHIRFESEHNTHAIAYGVYIPTIQLSTRDPGDPILNRRQQPGVQYPAAGDNTASKLLYLADISVYCDLQPSSFCGGAGPASPKSRKARLAFFREQCCRPFATDPTRDLVRISALWLKVDLVRGTGRHRRWGIGAIDVVTDEIQLHVDFTQLGVLREELTRLGAFFERTTRRQWRPSCIDREHVRPPQVKVASTSLLPLVAPPLELAFTADKQRRSGPWLRRMWRYAVRCVLVDRRGGNARHVRFGRGLESVAAHHADDPDHRHQRQERYIGLYKRGLSEEALKIVIIGRALLPQSPRATENRRKQLGGGPNPSGAGAAPALPSYAPLSLVEQWELSDLVLALPVYEQRVYRSMATTQIRHEYRAGTGAGTGGGASTPTTAPNLTIDASTPLMSPRGSTASVSPKRDGAAAADAMAGTPSTPTGAPPAFIANHHQHHFGRSQTESAILQSHHHQQQHPTHASPKHSAVLPPSPTAAGATPHLTHAASMPVHGSGAHSSTRSPTKARAAAPFSKQQWLVEALVPPWLLHRPPPLINWHIGPIALRLHHRNTTSAPTGRSGGGTDNGGDDDNKDVESEIPRGVEAYMELTLERCTGSLLLVTAPSVSFLVELRLGLVHAGLFHADSTSSRNPTGATSNAISTDYIRDESDGFLYLGLKYNFKGPARPTSPTMMIPTSGSSSATASPSLSSLLGSVFDEFHQPHHQQQHEDFWDVKGRLSVGRVRIEYNEASLQSVLHVGGNGSVGGGDTNESPHRRPSRTATAAPGPSLRLESATYVSILQDVLRNWQAALQRGSSAQPKGPTAAVAVATTTTARRRSSFARHTLGGLGSGSGSGANADHEAQTARAQQQRLATKRARLAKLVHALMQQSSTVEMELLGMDLQLTMLTQHLARVLGVVDPTGAAASAKGLFESEELQIELPEARAGLQNRPLLNECQVHAAGARVKFRTTQQGRAAVVEHVLRRLEASLVG